MLIQTSHNSRDDYYKLLIALQMYYSGSQVAFVQGPVSLTISLSLPHTHRCSSPFTLPLLHFYHQRVLIMGWPLCAVVVSRGRDGSKGYPWHWSCQSCSTELGHIHYYITLYGQANESLIHTPSCHCWTVFRAFQLKGLDLDSRYSFFMRILLQLLHTINGVWILYRSGDDVIVKWSVKGQVHNKYNILQLTFDAHNMTVKGQIFVIYE